MPRLALPTTLVRHSYLVGEAEAAMQDGLSAGWLQEAAADFGEARIDEAYRQKCRRYAKGIVDSTLTPRARSAALKLVPQE